MKMYGCSLVVLQPTTFCFNDALSPLGIPEWLLACRLTSAIRIYPSFRRNALESD
jgi:hypothetical protein